MVVTIACFHCRDPISEAAMNDAVRWCGHWYHSACFSKMFSEEDE